MTGKTKSNKTTPRRGATGPDGPGAFDPVGLAEKNFERVLCALDALADALDGQDPGAAVKAAKLATEARGAIQSIFNERQRLAKLDTDPDTDTTGAKGGVLDLDAARREIGRRLALLRERGGGAEVSRKPE